MVFVMGQRDAVDLPIQKVRLLALMGWRWIGLVEWTAIKPKY